MLLVMVTKGKLPELCLHREDEITPSPCFT